MAQQMQERNRNRYGFLDFGATRSANLKYQMPLKSGACSQRRVPRSVRMQQQIHERNRNPCG